MEKQIKDKMGYNDTGPICAHCKYYSGDDKSYSCLLNPVCIFRVKKTGGCKFYSPMVVIG